MVGKRSGKALLREEGKRHSRYPSYLNIVWRLTMCLLLGLERTDNNMDLTTWPQINPINQKNYYTYVMSSKARSPSSEKPSSWMVLYLKLAAPRGERCF